jgi:hypothetical protein
MNKYKKVIGYMQSFVAIPMLAVAAPLTGMTALPAPTAIVQSSNTTADAAAITTQDAQASTDKKEADILDAYFASYNSPLQGYGMEFVQEANKNGLDWRLLPAIAMRESTGGKQACKRVSNSIFGYGSCKINFTSIDESIETVAASLGGNNPNTAAAYNNKTTSQILAKYNTVIPGYVKQVQKIMDGINPTESVTPPTKDTK